MLRETADVQKEKGNKFIFGVYVMTLSTVIVKIIGLIYKIPMLKLIGSVGMGYFNSAYEIYAFFCIISTSGLPVAMSILISGTRDNARRHKIFKISLFAFFILGLVCMALILGLAYPFAHFLGSPETYTSLLCIAPAIFFICLSSAARGYFQGLGEMKQTAFSQLIEATGKLAFGLLFASMGIRLGLELPHIAGMAVLGLTSAEALCTLYLFASKKKSPKTDANGEGIFKSLMSTAIPITLSASVLSITKLIDMTMIFRRLGDIGYGSNLINSIYGSYTTLALPLFSLAPAIISGVSLPLVPAISSAREEGNAELQNNLVHRAFKLTTLISAPIGAGLALFSTPILELIFYGETEAIRLSAPLLSILGASVFMSCFITVQNALLQAYGKPKLPIVSMLAGSVVKLVMCYILLGNAEIHMYGIPISTFACDLCISVMNFYFLSKHSPLHFKFSDFLVKPYFSAILACAGGFMIYEMTEKYFQKAPLHTTFGILTSGLLYVVLLFVSRTMNKTELEILLLKKQNT